MKKKTASRVCFQTSVIISTTQDTRDTSLLRRRGEGGVGG